MLKTVEGIYRSGRVELAEEPSEVLEETRVLVTFLENHGIPLAARGIGESQAAAFGGALPASPRIGKAPRWPPTTIFTTPDLRRGDVMSQPLRIPPPGFDDLPVEEQIEYVQALWDHIAARPEEVPVPAWHREILAERLEAYEKDPQAGITWEEFRRQLAKDDSGRR